MKTKLLINTRIIDPQNNIDEVGGILIDENGKINCNRGCASSMLAAERTSWPCTALSAVQCSSA